MTPAAVGLRCPEHAGRRRPAGAPGRRVIVRAPQTRVGGTDALVTKTLIGINLVVYLIGAVQGAGLNAPGGELYSKLWLDAYDVHNGGWWRLITTAFLHASILHIAFNMLALWWFGAPVERYLGRARFLGLYLVSGLAGSAGALIQTQGVTVGASGAIFGILGAMLILEWQATGRLGGNAMTLIVINLVLSFAISNVSIGGHIGGLIGGIVTTLAYARWGRGHAAYGRLGLTGAAGLICVAVASVVIAYLQVRGYAS
jgi:membrane associated rhomboid family serine protease